MPNTYTQIYIHIIFSVKGRYNIVKKEHKEELHKYINGVISNKKQKLIAINCMPDHIHILVGLKPDIELSDLVRDIKANSSKFINKKEWFKGKFYWQEGFGGFSCSQSKLNRVVRYIQNQEEHHKVKSFREEYLGFLKRYNIKYDEKYSFD